MLFVVRVSINEGVRVYFYTWVFITETYKEIIERVKKKGCELEWRYERTKDGLNERSCANEIFLSQVTKYNS